MSIYLDPPSAPLYAEQRFTSSSCLRLLRPHLNDENSTLWLMEVHELNTCPEYIALSYTWGGGHADRRIQINGHKVLVRENLFLALKMIEDRAFTRSR
jgi:hypothetical protein